MRRAVEGLSRHPDHILVDARTIPGIRAPKTSLVRGTPWTRPLQQHRSSQRFTVK